ncbi:MAG: hypothetical protein ABI877_14455 [Gemmatimonadaceae bacterium]
MHMVMTDGDNRYRLEDSAGMQIGWVSGLMIGFRGFMTESDARDAAVAARQALDSALQREYTGWPRYEPAFDQIRTVHVDAHEWFYDGTAPIARLLRPQPRAYDGSFGIELILPSYASEGVAITAGLTVASAITPYRDRIPTVADRPPRRAVRTERYAPAPA